MSAEPATFKLARPARRVALGLTPLIDVVFILLLFFMLASNLQRDRSLVLDVSAPGSGPTANSTPAWRIELAANGTLALNGETMIATTLIAELARRLAAHPDARVLLVPADDVHLQAIVELLDRLADAGIAGVVWQ